MSRLGTEEEDRQAWEEGKALTHLYPGRRGRRGKGTNLSQKTSMRQCIVLAKALYICGYFNLFLPPWPRQTLTCTCPKELGCSRKRACF